MTLEPALRIAVLSFYYPPDLGPGALRAAAFVRLVTRLAPPNSQVEVITTWPNRYARYCPGADVDVPPPSVELRRERIKSGRVLAFARYARHALRSTAGRDYDLVFATSARLGTAVLGARVASVRARPLVVDLRDDVVADTRTVFGLAGWLVAPALQLVERYVLTRTRTVSVVAPAFAERLRLRWPAVDCRLVPHGIPRSVLNPAETKWRQHEKVEVIYAGTIGQGQALHRLIPDLAIRLATSHQFLIVGDGSLRAELARSVSNLNNVTLRDPVPTDELARLYAGADVLLVNLADGPAFEAVVPSKLFEVVALGKPIVAGVAGEAACFLRRNAPDARIFRPGDIDAAVSALRAVTSFRAVDRSAFRAAYDQDVVIEPLVRHALMLAGGAR